MRRIDKQIKRIWDYCQIIFSGNNEQDREKALAGVTPEARHGGTLHP